MTCQFEDVDLEDEQKDLLVAMVEAHRESREGFFFLQSTAGGFLHHEAMKRQDVLASDLRALQR